jgi:GT2 family glycosyltransferase
MNNKLSFSVVICTYKREKALKDTLISILKSTRKPDEILIIDDGDLPKDFISEMTNQFSEKEIPFVYKNKEESGMRR